MRLEDYLKQNNINYQVEYINGSKRVKIGDKIDIVIYTNQIFVMKDTKSYYLPPEIRSYELIKGIIDNE